LFSVLLTIFLLFYIALIRLLWYSFSQSSTMQWRAVFHSAVSSSPFTKLHSAVLSSRPQRSATLFLLFYIASLFSIVFLCLAVSSQLPFDSPFLLLNDLVIRSQVSKYKYSPGVSRTADQRGNPPIAYPHFPTFPVRLSISLLSLFIYSPFPFPFPFPCLNGSPSCTYYLSPTQVYLLKPLIEGSLASDS